METIIKKSEKNFLKSTEELKKEIDDQLKEEKKIFKKLLRKKIIKDSLCVIVKKN